MLSPHQISVPRVLDRLHPMANKDRATNPPPEKPGGEGWLVSPEQQLLCQFKPDSATVHAQWGVGTAINPDHVSHAPGTMRWHLHVVADVIACSRDRAEPGFRTVFK